MLAHHNQTEITLCLGNDAALDDDGWALIAPFGEWPKDRIANVNGRPTLQHFLQVLDNDSADTLLAKENGIFRKIKRALIGIPVYGGKGVPHPDVQDYAPETLSNARGEKKVIGVVDQVRKSAKGIEAHFNLTPDGAMAVENEGCKFPSAFWLVQPTGEARHGATVVRPFQLLSVGMTRTPNISGVESLANARMQEEQAQIETEEPPMKLIAGFLMAKGIPLANSEAPTETMVLEAIQKIYNEQSGRVVALGNEKDTLAGQLNTLNTKVTALENDKATLSGKVTALENERNTERKARIETVVDLAIAQGRLKVAERDARITALGNSQDLAKDIKTMMESAKIIRMPGDTESGKALANDMSQEGVRQTYSDAFQKHLRENPEHTPIQAHNAVLKAHPALAEALKSGQTEKKEKE